MGRQSEWALTRMFMIYRLSRYQQPDTPSPRLPRPPKNGNVVGMKLRPFYTSFCSLCYGMRLDLFNVTLHVGKKRHVHQIYVSLIYASFKCHVFIVSDIYLRTLFIWCISKHDILAWNVSQYFCVQQNSDTKIVHYKFEIYDCNCNYSAAVMRVF